MKTIKRNSEKQWYVFYVQTRHEKKVNKRLLEYGFEPYLPLKRVLKQWSQRKKWIEEPLFRSYIFVRISQSQLVKVLEVPGIITYVKHVGKPAVIRQQHIDLLRKMLTSDTTFELSSSRVEVGSEIEIQTGPFRGFKGFVKEVRGSRKLVVNLGSIDYTIIVELPAE